MQALLGTSLAVFIGLTVILFGGAAIMTGQALADNWKPAWHVVLACFGLALADRFLIYALFDGKLLSLSGFLVDFVVLVVMACSRYRITAVAQDGHPVSLALRARPRRSATREGRTAIAAGSRPRCIGGSTPPAKGLAKPLPC